MRIRYVPLSLATRGRLGVTITHPLLIATRGRLGKAPLKAYTSGSRNGDDTEPIGDYLLRMRKAKLRRAMAIITMESII